MRGKLGRGDLEHGRLRTSRRQAGEHGGQKGYPDREGKHAAIEHHRGLAGVSGGGDDLQHADAEVCETQAGERSSEGKQQAFGEGEADDMSPGGAEGDSYAEFALPPGVARQEHAGDVGAGDEQHQDDRAKQHPYARTHVARHFIVQ